MKIENIPGRVLFSSLLWLGMVAPAQGDGLATLGTENYPTQNTWWATPVTVSVAPNYWSTVPQPQGMPPAVWVQPLYQPAPPPGYVGFVPAPVFVNYRLWTP